MIPECVCALLLLALRAGESTRRGGGIAAPAPAAATDDDPLHRVIRLGCVTSTRGAVQRCRRRCADDVPTYLQFSCFWGGCCRENRSIDPLRRVAAAAAEEAARRKWSKKKKEEAAGGAGRKQ